MSKPDENGWVRFRDRWPTEADCDVYGQIEVAAAGSRGFDTLGHCEAFQYNLKRGAWWRTPTPLPDIP